MYNTGGGNYYEEYVKSGVPEIRQDFITMLACPCKQTSGTDFGREAVM